MQEQHLILQLSQILSVPKAKRAPTPPPQKTRLSSTPKSRKNTPKKRLSVQKSEKNRILELALSGGDKSKKIPERENGNTSTPSREMETIGHNDFSMEDDDTEANTLDGSKSGQFTDSPKDNRDHTSYDHSYLGPVILSHISHQDPPIHFGIH